MIFVIFQPDCRDFCIEYTSRDFGVVFVISGRFVLPYMGLPNFGDSRHSFLNGMTLFARFHRGFRDFRHDFRDFCAGTFFAGFRRDLRDFRFAFIVPAHSSREFAVIFVISGMIL